MINVALYARVSTEKQLQADTIASQIATLEEKIKTDGYTLLDDFKFIDNGYSGSHLMRPGLEKLRDKIFNGEVDKLYIHSPDRLSRKYAYQMLLLEEFQKAGVEIIFLNSPISETPESQLLLQMQGMIAEYERAKITERHRRGRIHAAKRGSVNALSGAPYGYRYVNKHFGEGQAAYEIQEEEAELVRKMFCWIGQERLSLGEVWRRLNKLQPITRKGKNYWNRATIWRILKNPAYKGQAAFGKRKVGPIAPRIRPQRHSREQPKWNYSLYPTEKEHWIYIPVPAIIDEELFEVVQEQLEENKKYARIMREKARNLLQGLTVCQRCQRAYYASSKGRSKSVSTINYNYYRCSGTNRDRFHISVKICDNKPVRAKMLEDAVWEEVKSLLKEPRRLSEAYEKKLLELQTIPHNETLAALEKQEKRLQQGASRLIDSYVAEQIDKKEYEPRIKIIKQKLKLIGQQKQKSMQETTIKKELQLVISDLEKFRISVECKLNNIDWHTKRDVIRLLVKRVEINYDEVNVVFRVPEIKTTNEGKEMKKQKIRQHCCKSIYFIAFPSKPFCSTR